MAYPIYSNQSAKQKEDVILLPSCRLGETLEKLDIVVSYRKNHIVSSFSHFRSLRVKLANALLQVLASRSVEQLSNTAESSELQLLVTKNRLLKDNAHLFSVCSRVNCSFCSLGHSRSAKFSSKILNSLYALIGRFR